MYDSKEAMRVIGTQGTKILRLFRSVVTFHASSASTVNEKEKISETYMTANIRPSEIEAQKAFIRAIWQPPPYGIVYPIGRSIGTLNK